MANQNNNKTSLTFFGGVDEVTGSRHFLRHGASQVLMDCGLFQGHRLEAIQKNKVFPFSVKDLNAVLLSHAHIDHSGGLPLLVKNGFSGPIHCTKPTADLCRIMLLDSAFLQEEDAKFFNKIHLNDGLHIDPLYTRADAEAAIKLFVPHDYDIPFEVDPSLVVRFLNAGHVLGSAMVSVTIKKSAQQTQLLFTGDLGRRKSLLMAPPVIPKAIDYLMIESTYGNREHEPIDEVESLFEKMINEAAENKGRILIPSFALERTQEIVFIIEKLRRERRIPPIHVYVDSPMAVNITEVFNQHLDSVCLADSFKQYVQKRGDPFGMDTVRYIRTVEESKRLNEMHGEKIIIAGSGMCEGGRILHHLRNNIANDNTTVLMVGYQAEGTLGRRLADGAKKVKIFGLQHEVRARVMAIQNLSSHADRSDLLWFIKGLEPRPKNIFLVHGDQQDREKFGQVLSAQGINRFVLPKFRESFLI